ncbi:hypothetical protein JKF63_03001 [Porcisia hertigi]|uniref:RBR-type E3 ubiquitin transferase n=1 Tax=Porcisia hertigi TaxID=2761500 RepID=A0A836LFX3_9TRYP|nr:hypothetical protein JKF63_03001 [Porcisia hertigi]
MYDPDYEGGYTYGEDEGDYTYGEEEVAPAVVLSSGPEAEEENDVCDGRTMDVLEALAMQSAIVKEVANLTHLSTSAATLLLRRYRWSRDVAVVRYFENSAAVLADLGVPEETASHEATLTRGSAGTPIVCEICAMEYNAHEVAGLSTCRHYFCVECWRDHIKSRVLENLIGTSCPEQGCYEVVGLPVMCELFADNGIEAANEEIKNTRRQIQRNYLTCFVETCPTLHWCPNPQSCSGVIHTPIPPLQGQGVRCLVCNNTYCLRCGYEPHRPATCDNMRLWKNYCLKEGANLAYILSHTKQCPLCEKAIEKSGGCNHMTCKCGHEFCWVCLGPWKQHTGDYYSCRNVEHHGGAASEEDVDSSKRFTYHYERYTLHLDSAKRDDRLVHMMVHNSAMRERIMKVQGQGDDNHGAETTGGPNPEPLESSLVSPTCASSEVISRVTRVLFRAREVLAYSYVAMFYLKSDNSEGQLMAHRIGKLEEATEALSGSLPKLFITTRSRLGTFLDAADVLVAWTRALFDV